MELATVYGSVPWSSSLPDARLTMYRKSVDERRGPMGSMNNHESQQIAAFQTSRHPSRRSASRAEADADNEAMSMPRTADIGWDLGEVCQDILVQVQRVAPRLLLQPLPDLRGEGGFGPADQRSR